MNARDPAARRPDLPAAIEAWRQVIGHGNVIDDIASLNNVATTTFATREMPLAIVAPADGRAVAECVRIAGRCGLSLYPVSGGKNWGLGGRVPSGGPAVLLDLSRMNRILGYDATLGTLTLEPGVTFRQVYDFLQAQCSPFWLAPIGGSDQASVIGNALERGEGPGPLGERSNALAGLQVVMADGDTVDTGFSRFEGARTAAISRHGVGPSLDGLFAQSNLGIVTRMSVWLAKQPKHQTRFTCRFAGPAALARGLDALRELHQQRVLTDCGFTVWNVYKYLALQGGYPWTALQGETPLPLPTGSEAQPFYCTGHLHAASDAVGDAFREEMTVQLAPHCDSLRFELIDAAARAADPTLDCGFPNPTNLRTAYWRKRGVAAGANPESDGCGVIWLCPALPFEGDTAALVMREMTAIGLAHGLEAHIGMSAMSPRLMHTYVSLMYDRALPGEDERAMACHDAMLAWLLEQGLPPYRLGIHSMPMLHQRDGPFERLLRRVRRQLDPQGTIAPGRYVQ
jgi:4-cresol dehydrogenase (hydroxylating)